MLKGVKERNNFFETEDFAYLAYLTYLTKNLKIKTS
jgi:hypothetical protein